ncbi:MAG TPA: hypothetical protein H9743_00450 [Candidatus Mediterraneibacter vanvlietii]|nr:hypothetical protein [Candidatus Mediterraneibacter vanvlietii]
MGEVIAFIVGAVFGVLSTCLIAAGRRDDDIQNMSIKQRNVSKYPEYEYEIRSDADGQKDS